MHTSISARAFKSNDLKAMGKLFFVTLVMFNKGVSMRFKLRAGPNTPLTGAWDGQICLRAGGDTQSWNCDIPMYTGWFGELVRVFPLPSTGACSPHLPAALFVKAFWQDLRLVDKH